MWAPNRSDAVSGQTDPVVSADHAVGQSEYRSVHHDAGRVVGGLPVDARLRVTPRRAGDCLVDSIYADVRR